ncbi:hypothetical protein DEO72_LG3g1714 [Vigna unguiculata]|uniref:Uncharacterized protein n=1 Tax=Vigna unguiculata TaxID=3917 RepID=A0A4D6LFA3_VIGUN|nr:hypothetical protein DEO72_LG3g1714 [Vigna unguiculata]
MTLEDDAIQRVRKLQEITKNTRERYPRQKVKGQRFWGLKLGKGPQLPLSLCASTSWLCASTASRRRCCERPPQAVTAAVRIHRSCRRWVPCPEKPSTPRSPERFPRRWNSSTRSNARGNLQIKLVTFSAELSSEKSQQRRMEKLVEYVGCVKEVKEGIEKICEEVEMVVQRLQEVVEFVSRTTVAAKKGNWGRRWSLKPSEEFQLLQLQLLFIELEEAPLVLAHVKVAPRKSRKMLDKEKWDLLGCRVMKRDAGTLAERQREGRDSGSGLAWWWTDARRDGARARVVVSHGGGWRRDETAVAGCETRRRWWQEAGVVVSSGGLAGRRGEKKKQRRRNLQREMAAARARKKGFCF